MKLSDHIRRIGGPVSGNFYMTKKDGYAHIFFCFTPYPEALSFINEMESQGYEKCSWLWWNFKKIYLTIVFWLKQEQAHKTKINSKKGLKINITEGPWLK